VINLNPSSILILTGLVGGFSSVALGALINSDFIRELGAFLLLFCIFLFPTVSRRDSESHGS